MTPQSLGAHERNLSMPQEKILKCDVDDKEAELSFDDHRRKFAIKHDPNMLVPVMNVKTRIKNYQCVAATFCSMIQDEGAEYSCDDLINDSFHPNNF